MTLPFGKTTGTAPAPSKLYESPLQKPAGPPGSACPPNPTSIPAGGILPFPQTDPGGRGADGVPVQTPGAKPPIKLGGG